MVLFLSDPVKHVMAASLLYQKRASSSRIFLTRPGLSFEELER
jgi:hypothetical protein